ncbi:7TM domain-containing protein [Aurantiacibacter hainanensis]|uniref:7TM domain-containing protein n=1 Tax=Aurantiacibacter hainanensis TaxID=3076114 RepID=UPI0030C6935A
MFSRHFAYWRRVYERATPQVRRPAYLGMAVCGTIGLLALWGLSNTRDPLSMPSALGGIAVSQAIWGLKPSNLLMVLPIGSFLVVLARSFIGLKAFGLFTPMLIALAFLQIGPIFGPIVLGTAVGIGMIVAPSLLKLRMTRVGFLGVLISLVVFVLAALQGILDTELQVDAMPVVVTALVVERWWRQWEKDGYFEAARMAFNTMMLALVIQFVMVSHVALMLIEVSPLLLPGFAAIAITILGRYRGLRMTEIGRFFPIWYEGWRRKMGWDEVIPEEAIGEVLAARAAIDQTPEPEIDDVKLTVFPKRAPGKGRPLMLHTIASGPAPVIAPKKAAPAAVEPEPEPVAAQVEEPAPAAALQPDLPLALPAEAESPAQIEPGIPANDEPDRKVAATPRDDGRLTQSDWDRIRAELFKRDQGTAHAAQFAQTPLATAHAADAGSAGEGLSAFFSRHAARGPIVDPALLAFLRPDRRHPGDQSAQRDHREIQLARGDRAGARQGGGKGGAGGARGFDNRHDRRHLRLWTA